MTLLDVKKQVLSLIEEYDAAATGTNYTNDPDIAAKLNYVINQVQQELAQIKRIKAKTTYTYSTTYEFDLPTGFYQVARLNYDYEIYGSKITILNTEDTSIDMYYYKLPTVITIATADNTVMEVEQDCLTALIYGCASDILKSDVSVDYTVYATRYNELKNELRLSNAQVFVDTTEAIDTTSFGI